MKKIIPYPTVIIIQFICFIFTILSYIPVILYAQTILKVLLISFISIFGLSNLIILIMSALRWWNVPITITAEGFLKKGKKYKWSDVVCISLTKHWKSQYGPIIVSITLKFSNDESVYFEKSNYILKLIYRICEDCTFVENLKREIDFLR